MSNICYKLTSKFAITFLSEQKFQTIFLCNFVRPKIGQNLNMFNTYSWFKYVAIKLSTLVNWNVHLACYLFCIQTYRIHLGRGYQVSDILDRSMDFLDRYLDNIQCVFLVSKVFVHLNHLELPQISQTYLQIFVLLKHFIKNTLNIVKKLFWGIFCHKY